MPPLPAVFLPDTCMIGSLKACGAPAARKTKDMQHAHLTGREGGVCVCGGVLEKIMSDSLTTLLIKLGQLLLLMTFW